MSMCKCSSIFLASKILCDEGFVLLFGKDPIIVDIVDDFVRYLNFRVFLVELFSKFSLIEFRKSRWLNFILLTFSLRSSFLTIFLGSFGFLLLLIFFVSFDFFCMVFVEFL